MGIVRSALRHLAGAPGFTTIAILSLTLGIGPTTAIFSLIDELLLRSLPVTRPDELVLLRVQHGVRGAMSHAGEGSRRGRSGDRSRDRHAVVARDLRAAPQHAGAGGRRVCVRVVLACGRDRGRCARGHGVGPVRLGWLLRRPRRRAGAGAADRAGRRRDDRRARRGDLASLLAASIRWARRRHRRHGARQQGAGDDRRRVGGRLRRRPAGRRDRRRVGAAGASSALPARSAGPRRAELVVAHGDGAARARGDGGTGCGRRSSPRSRQRHATAG